MSFPLLYQKSARRGRSFEERIEGIRVKISKISLSEAPPTDRKRGDTADRRRDDRKRGDGTDRRRDDQTRGDDADGRRNDERLAVGRASGGRR